MAAAAASSASAAASSVSAAASSVSAAAAATAASSSCVPLTLARLMKSCSFLCSSAAAADASSSDDDMIEEIMDWSGLPPDMLHLISLFLTNIWDYLRFRGVCASWRFSCTARPPQIPLLLLPYDPDTTARSFLDPSDFRITTIDIPEARGKWTYGTPHGWMVMLIKTKVRTGYKLDVCLLNPITRDHISLPPLPLLDMAEMTVRPSGRAHHTKPFLTANPNFSSHQDFLALLVMYKLAFCRLGGDVCTVVDVHVNKGIAVVDFTYFNGAFYVVNATGGITVVNATTLNKTYTAPPTPRLRNTRDDLFLVESSGDLLLLERTSSGSVPVFDVFKLDNTGEKLKWARIEESIGDRVLFVSCNRSTISLSSGDYIRSRGDLICFAGCCYNHGYANMVANIHISDIVAGSSSGKQRFWKGSRGARRLSNSLLGLTWIIPSLR